jgi:NhaC family Na+:H+ antiporter
VQGESISNIIKYIFSGYVMSSDSPLKEILKGGGIFSMLKVALIVFVSSAFSGIFEGTNVLSGIEQSINKYGSGMKRFLATIIVSTASAAFGCSQAIAIILTGQLIEKNYDGDKYKMAVDIENTAVVISPLLPWNIAGLVPAQILSVGPLFIPFAFYLYLLPAINLIAAKKKEMGS